MIAGTRDDAAGDAIVAAHPHPYPLATTRAALAQAIDSNTATAHDATKDPKTRKFSAIYRDYFRLVDRAYSYPDTHQVTIALAVIAAGFSGTPDELAAAVAASTSPGATG